MAVWGAARKVKAVDCVAHIGSQGQRGAKRCQPRDKDAIHHGVHVELSLKMQQGLGASGVLSMHASGADEMRTGVGSFIEHEHGRPVRSGNFTNLLEADLAVAAYGAPVRG